MIRDVDVSGVSGTGHVAEVAVFSDGQTAVHWLGDFPTTTPHVSMKSVEHIHGHGGATRFVPVDDRDVIIAKLQAELEVLRAVNGGWRALMDDLDRCPHGRHQIDPCASCPSSGNTGNPHLKEGDVVGYTVYAKPIVVPASEDRFDIGKWRPRRRG
jgi:hypothetical protein